MRRTLLFVDQFEELYTLNTDRDTRRAFVACLEGVADDASSPLRVVLSLRSDFLDRVADNQEFTSDIIRGMVLLSPMARRELREALIRPLDTVGHRFETQQLIDTDKEAAQARASAAHARNASRMASALVHRSDATLVLALVRDMEPIGARPPGWRAVAQRAMREDIAHVVHPHPDMEQNRRRLGSEIRHR